MKYAVIGGGVAGVAASWYLLQKKGASVDLFDLAGIGAGASGVSSGLLYPFQGRSATKTWRADEGMAATKELVQVAEKELGKPVSSPGIFRPAVTEEQKQAFHKEGIWWGDLQLHIPRAAVVPGLWIPEGLTVFAVSYLKGLWQACVGRGAQLIREKVESLDSLQMYDGVVIGAGCGGLDFPECRHLPLKTIAGQILVCEWEDPLPFSLVSVGHIALSEQKNYCRIGSTYEHGKQLNPQVEQELKQKVAVFYPPAAHFKVVDVQSGIRVSPQVGYQPLVKEVREKMWILTGLGSRGMIYHALLGKELAQRM